MTPHARRRAEKRAVTLTADAERELARRVAQAVSAAKRKVERQMSDEIEMLKAERAVLLERVVVAERRPIEKGNEIEQ